MNTVEWHDKEDWIGSGEEANDNDDEKVCPVNLLSGKLKIPNRDQLSARMAEVSQIIIERNSVRFRGKSNVVIDSFWKVCFKMVNKANRVK